jgi:hypothetical protein
MLKVVEVPALLVLVAHDHLGSKFFHLSQHGVVELLGQHQLELELSGGPTPLEDVNRFKILMYQSILHIKENLIKIFF